MNYEYVKLNTLAQDYAAVRAALAAHFQANLPNNLFSENLKADGSVSWCKVVTGHGVTGNAIVARMGEDHHDQVLAETTATDWIGAQA